MIWDVLVNVTAMDFLGLHFFMTSSIGRVYRPHVSIFDFCIWQMVLLDGKNEREMRGIVWKRKNQWGEVRDRQREEKKRENEKVRGRARMAALTKSESQTKNGDASKKKLLSFTSALLSFILSAFTFRHSICVLLVLLVKIYKASIEWAFTKMHTKISSEEKLLFQQK